MTSSIKNERYAFLIRLDLMLFMSFWKEFQLLQILNDLSNKHLIKLILYEDDVKLLKFKRRPVQVDLWYVCRVRFWLYLIIPDTWNEYIKKSNGMVNLFFYRKFNVRFSYLKNLKNLMNLFHCQKQLECHQHILNKS